jgi:hypothetical protein
MDPTTALMPMTGMPGAPSDLMGLLAEDLEPPDVQIGPRLPEDYTPAKRPNKKYTTEQADEIKGMHAMRLREAQEMAEWLNHTRVGYFEDDEDDIIDGLIETMPITTLAADHHYAVGAIAGMEPYVTLLNRDTTETEEALAIEDAVYYLLQCQSRQYQREYGQLIAYQRPNHLMRFGALVSLATVNPDNEECGIDMSLINPLTVFPVWEGKAGLTEVFRVYEDTIPNIAGNYGGRYGKERDRIERILKKIGGDGADRLAKYSVVELWNRDWVQVVVDDREVLTRRHGYARVPYTISLGGFDQPPGVSVGMTQEPFEMNTLWGSVQVTDDTMDIARQWRPFAYRKIKPHAIKEAVYGRMLTNFKDARNPAKIYEFDVMTQHLNTGEISFRPGHLNEIPLGNKLSAMPTAPGAEVVAPLMMGVDVNSEQGPWSQLRAGMIPPQTSDSALGTMLELGGADRAILASTIQSHITREMEWCLEILRDWGPSIKTGPERGVLYVQTADGYGNTPLKVVTPEMIERAGTYIDITLFHFRPNPAMAQFINAMRAPGGASGKPLVSDETARRHVKMVPDPDREGYRIEREQLNAAPPIAIQRQLKLIDEEIAREIELGDDDNADALMVSGIELDFMHMQQVLAGQAAPPPPPPVPPGAAAGANTDVTPQPLPSTPPDMQGMSNPQMGKGVGMQGGRPQGAGQPKEPTRATGVTAPQR